MIKTDEDSLKLTEENKETALEWLRVILESSHDGIYITDGCANTVLVNKAYETITGLPPAQVMHKNMALLVKEKMIDRSGTLMAIEKKQAVTMNQTFRTGRRALITSTPVFDEQGEIVFVVTNVRDVTDLYELQSKYEESQALTQKYSSEIEYMRRQFEEASSLVARDIKMIETLKTAEKIAALDTTVLLLGETGVGKEKVAHYIYRNSARRDRKFITINCGAIPPALVESELFGYEKGAFTGALKEGKAGLFEVADKGTVFLDEIGELPLEMQVKLLRVLQERKIERVGGVKQIPLDIRIIAATNRNLSEMVREKTFREDLFYRLNVVPVTIPPLRERKNDIPALAERFIEEFNRKYQMNKRFSAEALQCMMSYEWPGNVRELKNITERVVIMSGGNVILRTDLPFAENKSEKCQTLNSDDSRFNGSVNLKGLLETIEAEYMTAAYERFGNVRAAAASLGMDASTFVRKRKKYENNCLL